MSDFDVAAARDRAYDQHQGVYVTLELACDEIDRLREQVQSLQAERDTDARVHAGVVAGLVEQRQEADRHAEARLKVLRQVEWGDFRPTQPGPEYDGCPCCYMAKKDGHADNCALAAVLTDEDWSRALREGGDELSGAQIKDGSADVDGDAGGHRSPHTGQGVRVPVPAPK